MDRDALLKGLNRHRREKRRSAVVTGFFYVANIVGLPTLYLGVDAALNQGCARDMLCEMAPDAREAVRAQKDEDRQLADTALTAGGLLVAGNIAFYLSKNR